MQLEVIRFPVHKDSSQILFQRLVYQLFTCNVGTLFEFAVLVAVELKDEASFERNVLQLKPLYLNTMYTYLDFSFA